MELFSIASGSSGNCICVGNDTSHVMIDCGVSGKWIENGMNEKNYTTSDMQGLLITHEHSDHVSGLGVISRKYHLPIYTTRGTWDAISRMKRLGDIDQGLFHEIRPDEDFAIGSLLVHPIRISHDAAEPVAFVIRDDKKSVGVITDLGIYNDYIIDNIRGLDAVLLEANHDLHMLEVGPYPYRLKRRIMGERGHLSNELSGQLLGHILHDRMKHILLGHLSKKNNYEELCLQTVRMEVTLGDNPYKAKDFPITIASREQASELIAV